MRFKQGVKFKGVQPEMVLALIRVGSLFDSFKIPFIVTSISDGIHSKNSLHYKGYAVDLRSKHIQTNELKLALLSDIKEALGDEFDVILEHVGKENEHIHIEFDPD